MNAKTIVDKLLSEEEEGEGYFRTTELADELEQIVDNDLGGPDSNLGSVYYGIASSARDLEGLANGQDLAAIEAWETEFLTDTDPTRLPKRAKTQAANEIVTALRAIVADAKNNR